MKPHHNGLPSPRCAPPTGKRQTMLGWTVILFIIAIIAAAVGFGGIAAGAASIGQILFFIFLVLLAIYIAVHLLA